MRPQQRSFVHSGRSARVAHCARQELRFAPGVQDAWFVLCLSRRNALLLSVLASAWVTSPLAHDLRHIFSYHEGGG